MIPNPRTLLIALAVAALWTCAVRAQGGCTYQDVRRIDTTIQHGPFLDCGSLVLRIRGVRTRLLGCPTDVVITTAHTVTVDTTKRLRAEPIDQTSPIVRDSYYCSDFLLLLWTCRRWKSEVLAHLPNYAATPCDDAGAGGDGGEGPDGGSRP